MTSAQPAIDRLVALFQQLGEAPYIGEPVSQLEHALQCAALASQQNDDELILAALLHDVGHSCFADAAAMDGWGTRHHEQLGADYLSYLGFSPRVAALVEGHVEAKRYLVATNPDYAMRLSEASTATLAHQGGPMSTAEVSAFEQNPDKNTLLRLRAWDEAAKMPGNQVPGLKAYVGAMSANLDRQRLSDEQIRHFHEQGYLHIRNHFSPSQIQRLRASVDDLQARPETAGAWMKYFEPGANAQRLLCRVENFIQYEANLGSLITGPLLGGWLAQLMGEPAYLFKEKINFKLPGAAGFTAHQDAPAFTSFDQDYHITVMLSFDASTTHNGCLELVPGRWQRELLPMKADKTLSADCIESLHWQPLETAPGDIVLFGSYLPHRSGPNRSDASRRALYATYNPRSAGDVRDAYFARKREIFPPDIEKEPGRDYGDAGVFNVGNPIN